FAHTRKLAAIDRTDRIVAGSAEIPAAIVAVPVRAEISHVVVVRSSGAEHGGPLEEAVAVVVVGPVALAVAVVEDHPLRREPLHRPVLPIEVGDENIIGTPTLCHVVQSAVGVLLQPAQPRQVVLPAIAVA